MRRRFVRSLPPLALLAAATPALAQTTPPPPATDDGADEEGVITVLGLPDAGDGAAFGAELLDGERLSATASGRLEEALARIPGFQQFRRSDGRSANLSAQGVTLRGIGGNATSRTLVLRDGVPVADAFFGYVPFTALPLAEVGGVTVTRGSGAGPFGAGALAGTIAIDSLALARRAPASFALTAGSDNGWRGDISIVRPLGSGHIAFDAHHDRGDGFWTTPEDQRVAASVPARYRATALSLTAEAPLSTTVGLQARVGLFRDDRTLRFAGADNGGEGADASLRLTGSGDWQWDALAWVQARDFSSIVVSATSFRPTLDQRATPTTGWGAKLELRPPLGAARPLRLGLDVRGATGEAVEDALATSGARTLTRGAGGNARIAGVWAEWGWTGGPLSLTLGGRVDRWWLGNGHLFEARADGSVQTDSRFADRDGTIASGRAGGVLTLADGLSARAALYTGFRLPTLNELYRGFTVFPVVTRANAALAPERLRGGEVAIDWSPDPALALSATAFDNRLKDAIANVTIAANVRQRRNVAAVRARGVELSARLMLGNVRIDAGLAHSDARLSADPADSAAAALDGLRPAQSPVWSGGATLAWTAPGGTGVFLALRHIGAQWEDDRNVDRLPSATTMDAMFTHPLTRRLSASLSVENLWDEQVVTRNVAGSVDLGAPRTLWLGLRWRAQ